MGSADKKIEKPMKEGQDTVWFDEPSFPRDKNTQEVQPPEGEVWHEHTKQVTGVTFIKRLTYLVFQIGIFT